MVAVQDKLFTVVLTPVTGAKLITVLVYFTLVDSISLGFISTDALLDKTFVLYTT